MIQPNQNKKAKEEKAKTLSYLTESLCSCLPEKLWFIVNRNIVPFTLIKYIRNGENGLTEEEKALLKSNEYIQGVWTKWLDKIVPVYHFDDIEFKISLLRRLVYNKSCLHKYLTMNKVLLKQEQDNPRTFHPCPFITALAVLYETYLLQAFCNQGFFTEPDIIAFHYNRVRCFELKGGMYQDEIHHLNATLNKAKAWPLLKKTDVILLDYGRYPFSPYDTCGMIVSNIPFNQFKIKIPRNTYSGRRIDNAIYLGLDPQGLDFKAFPSNFKKYLEEPPYNSDGTLMTRLSYFDGFKCSNIINVDRKYLDQKSSGDAHVNTSHAALFNSDNELDDPTIAVVSPATDFSDSCNTSVTSSTAYDESGNNEAYTADSENDHISTSHASFFYHPLQWIKESIRPSTSLEKERYEMSDK